MKKKFRIIFALVALFAIIASFCAGCANNKTALASPTGFNVSDDYLLTWNDVTSARGYEVRVNRLDGTNVTSQPLRRASVSLSFLEEGDYRIAVKTVSDGVKYSDSEWSDEFDFHKNYESGCIYTLINNNSEYEISSCGSATGEVTVEEYYRDKPVTSIGFGAFKQSLNLTKIIIGDKVEKIGSNAFYRCTNLEEVVIPQSVTQIGSTAFQSCDKIKSITLPDAIEEIEEFTFAYCSGLTSIDLTHVKTIGESAFSNCIGLQNIVIPDGVTSIAKNAFLRCISAETLTLGNGITYLPQEAFALCENLKTVNFGIDGNLVSLGAGCFSECKALEEIELPAGLQSIGWNAFDKCEKLDHVTIPDSVTDVGGEVFDDTKIYDDAIAGGAKIVYVDDWLVATKSDVLTGVTRLSTENLKAGLVGIASNAFRQRGMDDDTSWSLELPSSVKYICSGAFGKTKVWRIVSGNGSKLQSIGDGAFYECDMLRSVVLVDGLKSIGGLAFGKCTLLNNSTMFPIVPSTVERVGAYAFRDTELYNHPDEYGVVYAGEVGNEGWVVDYVKDEDNPVATVELKTSVYGIADYAFADCDSIRSVMGLNRASIIGNFAFAGCSRLSAVSLNPNLDTIKESTFISCGSLTDVSLPSRIKSIGNRAFANCRNLAEVKNLNSNALTSIGYAAFAYCNDFVGENKRLQLGANLKDLGEYAFYGCLSLDNVIIPDGLKVISAHAFSHCYKLANFDFGNGVEEIGDYAFYSEDIVDEKGNLLQSARGVKINLPASVKKIGNYAFFGCGRGYSMDDMSSDIWGDGSGMDKAVSNANLGNVEEIGDFAFANATLGDMALPDSLKSIGKYAFYNSTLKSSLIIGDNVENIDRHAFNGCSNITFYCENEKRPESWDARWNSSYIPVIWGCTLSEEGYVESLKVTSETISHALNGIKAPVRRGYQFLGWSTVRGSATATYSAEGITEIPVGTTVYAVWLELTQTT